MKVQALRAALAFALLCSFAALAGQDRALYAPGGGPGQGGVVRSLLVLGATYWAGVEGGGIYKSTDGGATWTASHQGLGHKLVRGLGAAPGSSTTLYAVTNGGGGFYKSTDGGANWFVSNSGLNCTFISAINVINTGANLGRIYLSATCGGASGVYSSIDQGATWSLTGSGTMPTNTTVISLSGAPDGVFLRASTTAGVYFSSDSGATWTLRNGTVPNNLAGPNGALTINTSVFGPNTVAVVDGNGVFYSPDGGTNWTQAGGLPPGADGIGGIFNFFPGASTAYVVVDGDGIYTSIDSGVTWTPETTLFNGLPTKRVRTVFREGAGPNYWALTYAGVYKSTDGAANFTKMSSGLPQGWVQNASVASGGSQTVFAASDTIYKSTDGGVTWSISDSGLGGAMFVSSLSIRGPGVVQIHPTDPSIVYASTVSAGMFKSTDGGATWSAINNGLPGNLSGRGGNFRISTSNPSVLYVPLGGVLYRTVDGGANWSNVWTAGSVSTQFARAPAIDPTNHDIVYVATAGGLYKTTDGGVTWLAKHPGGFNATFGISRPQVMTGAPQNVLAAAVNTDSRDIALSSSGIYLSTNGGDTWRQGISNEKIPQAIFVTTPGSSKVNIVVGSLGHFDEPSAGPYPSGGVFRCNDVALPDFQPDRNCTMVDLGADPALIRSFAARSNRLLAIATTAGLAKHEFMFLGPDFNNDSRGDILWRNPTNGGTTIWQMDGARLIGERENAGVAPLRTVASPWAIAGFGDFDGDGTSDILWRNSSTGENYIYFMDGGIILPSEGYIRTIADQTWVIAGVGDFDGDGRSDILWRNTVSGDNYIYFMNGLQIVNEGYIRNVPDQNWSVAGVGDFNGNGKADILWRNGSTGENYIYLMNGTAVAGEGYTRTVPLAWQVKALGDFNQDNKMDIVWRNSSTGENYVYPMDGVAILPSETYLPTVADTTWNIVGAGDYDGPNASESVSNGLYKARGVSGILWRNATTGAAYMWRMSSPLQVADSPCGNMGCPQGSFLPQVSDTNWQVINK